LEEVGQAAAAEPFYRRFARAAPAPEGSLQLAQYLGRRGQMKEALELCETAWKSGNLANVANASLVVLHSAPATEEQFDRVETHLKAALEKEPKSTDLAVCLADLWDLHGKQAKAISLYREIIKRDENNVVALNNLAWLLAQTPGGAGEAFERIKRALDVAGPLPELLDTRALIYLSSDDPERALADLEEALSHPRLQPRLTAWLQYHKARAYTASGDRQNALKALQSAKTAGLEESTLHPLERQSYRALLSVLRVQ
jgi:tetratricopeptide (TPR) repeat protein